MNIKKIVSTFLFLSVLIFSNISFADESKNQQNSECDKLVGGIFAMFMIAGLPPEVSGTIAEKKGKECKESKDTDKTVIYIQKLIEEYLAWRHTFFECSFVVGKMSSKGQMINGEVIKDFEQKKINECVDEVLKLRIEENKKL